ncbi:MAG: DNA repair protein RecO [Candidatus Altimarinota bacterium]
MKFIHDEGVVLRKYDIGEKDEVVVLLTKHHGKMVFVARGSRDPKSRKAGALQLFNTIAFQARVGRGKLPYLEQVKSLNSRSFSIVGSESLDAFYRASEMLKLTDSFIQESQSVQNVYEDLNLALDHISQSSVVFIFWIRLLQDFGALPDWSSCCICHEALSLDAPLVFSSENKGFAHQACLSFQSPRVEPSVIKLMSFYQRAEMNDSLRVIVKEPLLQLVRQTLQEIQLHH